MWKSSLGVLTLLCIAAMVRAEDVPTYEGVYLETSDGFLELSALPSYAEDWQHVYFDDGEPIVACISMDCVKHSFLKMFSVADMVNLPTVDASDVKRIATNGRDISVIGVTAWVAFDDFFEAELSDARLQLTSSGVLNEAVPGQRYLTPYSRDLGVLVGANWGLWTDDGGIRTRNIDNFNAKHDFPGGAFSFLINRVSPDVIDIYSSTGHSGDEVTGNLTVCASYCEAKLFVVMTNAGYYPFLLDSRQESFSDEYPQYLD